MTPEERDAFVAKLKEERLNKRRAKNVDKQRAWRRTKDPAYIKRMDANRSLRVRHGITLEEKEAMIAKWNNRCPICDTTNPGKKGWNLDHCHTTKKVRDPLCYACNSMLGYARDDVSILLRAIYYLDRHSKPVTF